MKRLFFLFLILPSLSYGQPQNLNSSEIYLGLKKLATVGNVMYIAAHPDDENTLMITWLSKERHVRTAYFAMTRGDGGQNLIGPEQGEFVGLLRTHELLEARKVDGGEQFFSRAVDFGFSKSTEETLRFWDKEKVLGDLVYRIRKFKPDIIINRFPPDSRAGHGHHSASAVLSIEAFDLAADPKAYPEQLEEVDLWQVKRLFWNTFGGGFTNPEPEDNSFLKISLGDFNPLLGESYTELAARARSKHRSQGFGSAPSRGDRFDYLIPVKGEPAVKDPFEGVDLSWNRVEGGKKIAILLEKTIKRYDFKNPSASLRNLLKIYDLIQTLPSSVYKEEKLAECVQLILNSAGLYVEANAAQDFATPGLPIEIKLNATKRSHIPVSLTKWAIWGEATKDTVLNTNLSFNEPITLKTVVKIPETAAISQPYWLQKTQNIGSYNLNDEQYRNLPMAPDPLWTTISLEIEGTQLNYSHPVKYKYTEPSRGEIYKYFEIRPHVVLNFNEKVYVAKKSEPLKVGLAVKSHQTNTDVNVKLDLPSGWKSEPEQASVKFDELGEKSISFEVTPNGNSSETEIKAIAFTDYGESSFSSNRISYEHVPELNTYPPAQARVIVPDLTIKGEKVGYIMGAGDDVPLSLEQMGYKVSFINEQNIQEDLSSFDAIVVGVRAYNTKDWLVDNHAALMEYVKNGGTVLTQYQTQAFFGKLKIDQIGPHPITINRDRVTEEDAKVSFINDENPVLNYPNKITEADFDGWVQERGLYFAEKWSEEYVPVLSMHDIGEKPLEGSLLYTSYGKGYFIFTGISFFRQLPAGVPGAYRLMANLISIGK